MSKPVIWTIAGYDPSSGAGITADLRTISSLGCYGVSCITALTVQNTIAVRRVEPVSPNTVRETLEALLEDLPPTAIKIGMLATSEIATEVAAFLSALPAPRCPIVLDPILRSSSGAELLDHLGTEVLLTRLLPLCTVVTPNRREAAALTGMLPDDPEASAKVLRKFGAAAAVVTGGDAIEAEGVVPSAESDAYSEDILAYAANGQEFVEMLRAPRVRSSSTHGTGCAFSSAIACGLAKGMTIPAAVTAAKAFVVHAISTAPGLGRGRGPMGLDSCPGQ